MDFRPTVLQTEIASVLIEINKQIDEIDLYAESMNMPNTKLRDANGNWVLIPLLAAKVQALHALTLLNTKEK